MPRNVRVPVTRAELAALLAVSIPHVSRLVAAGLPERRAGGGPGRKAQYDAVACLAWWRQQRFEGGVPNGGTSARDKYLELLTERVRQELLEKRGELVSREAVILAGRDYTRAWAAKVRALPYRLIQTGVIGREQQQAATLLCHEILSEIARWKTSADLNVAQRPRRRVHP